MEGRCEQGSHLLGVGGEGPCPIVAGAAKVCERPLCQPHWAPIPLEETLQVCLQRCCGSLGVTEVLGVPIPTRAAIDDLASPGRCYAKSTSTAKLLLQRSYCWQGRMNTHSPEQSNLHVWMGGHLCKELLSRKGSPVNGHEVNLVLVCFDLHRSM